MQSRHLNTLSIALASLAGLLGAVALYYVFLVVPNERTMGAVQRIFYFHVGSAVSSYLAILIMVCSGVVFLQKRSRVAGMFNLASAEVALLFCTITLLTGMIWGKAAWNTAFQMEPRLVSFLMLWFIILAANLLEWFGNGKDTSSARAVFSILAAFSIPIVIFSVKLLPQTAQLHPQVLENRGLKDPSFEIAFLLSLITLLSMSGALVVARTRQLLILHRLVFQVNKL